MNTRLNGICQFILAGLALAWIQGCRHAQPAPLAPVKEEASQRTEPEPADAESYLNRGKTRMAKDDFKRAIADYDRAIALDSNLAAAYRARGSAKFKNRDSEGAIEDCTHAIDLNRDDVEATVTRGHARQASGDLIGAISDFTLAISREPQNAFYYEYRAVARGAKGNAGALGDFQKAIELEPKLAAAYRDRGELRLRNQDLDRALSDFDSAISFDSRDVRAYALRREARLLRAEVKGALDDATQVVNLVPNDPGAYSDRGMNFMLLRQWPEALADYRKSIEISGPSNDDAHLYVWLIRARLGQTDAANAELAAYEANRPAASSSDWHASAANFLLGKISEEKLLAASTAGTPFATHRLECRAWYYIGMKKSFAKDIRAMESLARCIMDEQLATPELQLAVTELRVLGRPPRQSAQEALNEFIGAIPFKNAYTSKSDEHSITFLSKKARDNQPGVHPEAVLDFYGPLPWKSDQSLEDHLRVQIANIHKQFSIAPYPEQDHAPADNVVHFIETINSVQVGFIKFATNIQGAATPPFSMQAVILKDEKHYTISLTTFVPETQEGYRQDERLLIETLTKNGKL